MLERHSELAREMKLYEKMAIDELSVEDIAHYLGLRREYEELQNQVVSLIPTVLEKIRNLLKQSLDKLAELTFVAERAVEEYAGRTNYSLQELVEVTGELEADVEKVAARCSRLEEIARRTHEARNLTWEEAACAIEAAEASAKLEAEQAQTSRAEQKVAVSPDTIKKIEMMVRPKEVAGNPLIVPGEEKQKEKIIKISAPPEPKNRPPKQGNKDRVKR